MDGLKLETGIWWWAQAGHTDTWLPRDPPQIAMSWVRQTENICDQKPDTCVKLETVRGICGTCKVKKRLNERYWKFEFQKNLMKYFPWHSQYIHSFQRRAELQRQPNICTFVIDSTAACALQRQHKRPFILNDHNDQSHLKMRMENDKVSIERAWAQQTFRKQFISPDEYSTCKCTLQIGSSYHTVTHHPIRSHPGLWRINCSTKEMQHDLQPVMIHM